MTDYVIGIDGGGTKTQAVIMNGRGEICGTGFGGPSNFDDLGIDTARDNIALTVNEARTAAELKSQPFAAAFLGLGGVAAPEDRAILRQIGLDLALAPPDTLGVGNDNQIALAGGLSGRPGIVLIVGTGSSCYGRNAAGQEWRAGGWGPLVADEGSGHWLGVEAMKAAVRAFDGRAERTMLLESVMEQLALPHMNNLLHHLYVTGMSRSEIAALAPLVITAAQEGDAIALALFRQGARDLAECVLSVAQRLDIAGRPAELALTGGLVHAGDIVVQPLREEIMNRLPGLKVGLAELPPVVGAGLLALELIGTTLDPDAMFSLEKHAASIR